LLAFITRHEKIPVDDAPEYEAHLRARAAVLSALALLRDAYRRHDDRPLPVPELVATIRRWLEGQTFSPRKGHGGVLFLDTRAAAFADIDALRIVGLVESDWPERRRESIFYPAALLRELGWPPESERLAAARAHFNDLLVLASRQVSISSFTLEDDAVVSPSAFLDDIGAVGLAVERSPVESATRIFEHEALSIQPVVPEAVSQTAREWLHLRRARTASVDSRYHGTVGARASEVYAVSRVEQYLQCPFKYFAGQVLQLDEEREDESGLTPQERGQLLHGVFEAFFKAWRARGGGRMTSQNLGAAVALFEEVADDRLAALPEADRALERTYLLGSAASPGLAERAFAFEIEHGVDVLERLLEHELTGSFRFDGAQGTRDVRLRGKADRIDLLADGTLRVVDYKLGRAPKPARSLQLPVYSVCAQQQLEGYLGRSWSLGYAGYVAFREKNPFVELRGKAGNLTSAISDGQIRFLDAIARIEAGEFPPSPDEPWTCTRCGFPHVCRKDYVGDE
jgi:RecB family exonuclease